LPFRRQGYRSGNITTAEGAHALPAPLPPLPIAFRVSDDDAHPGGRSMVDILVDDHHRISALCDQLHAASSAAPAAGPVADVLIATLSRHLSAEEQYLYPTVRAVLPDGSLLADQELAEDAAMLRTLKQLHTTPVDDPGYTGLVDVITRRARRHAERASQEVFPRLRERCTGTELVRLGNRVEIAQEAAPTRPHPATPATPPANKVVDPCVGVVDKVRDVLSRRVTWPEDL
jgi:hypothetical protein